MDRKASDVDDDVDDGWNLMMSEECWRPEAPVLSKRDESSHNKLVVPTQTFSLIILPNLDRDKHKRSWDEPPSLPYLDHLATYQHSSLKCRELSLDAPITCL